MKHLQETKQESLTKEAFLHTTDEKIVVTQGDIFLLGNHILLCGDSRDVASVESILKGKEIWLLITDPPYGIDYVASKEGFNESTKVHEDIANDGFQSDEHYEEFTKNWLLPIIPFLKEKNASYIFNADKMIFALRNGMLQAWWKFSQLIIWVKDSAIIWRLDYLPQHELIAYGWYGKHAFYGAKSKSVLTFAKIRKNTIHPTMKPIPLLRELILNSSKLWDTVYDPFGGSGSTLIASEQTGRICIMVEQSPIYVSRIIDRWEKLTGKKSKKLTSNIKETSETHL